MADGVPRSPRPDFDAATQFWLQVSGSTLSRTRGPHDQFATLIPADGDAYLRVQRVIDGPGGCHLDVHVDDIPDAATASGRAWRDEARGARRRLRPPLTGGAAVLHRSTSRGIDPTPPAALRDAAARTAIDQLCIDIAPDDYEQECGFWEALTGWERRPARLPEFSYLARPEQIPLRLLLQRLDDADRDHTAGAHLDLACENRDAAVTRHVGLGARVEARHEYWTTMTDPSGLPYCLTRRNPDTGLVDSPT